jgi:hypothetical protein
MRRYRFLPDAEEEMNEAARVYDARKKGPGKSELKTTYNYRLETDALTRAAQPERSADLKSLDFRGTWGEWIEMEYTEQQKADFWQRFGLARGK